MRLKINLTLCTGCRLCETVCSALHSPSGRANSSGSAVRIKLDPFHRRDRFMVCYQCKKAHCIESCERGALYKEEGVVTYNADICDFCGKCVEACPLEGIWLVPDIGRIIKCDLCTGRSGPQCIEACPVDAITLSRKKENDPE